MADFTPADLSTRLKLWLRPGRGLYTDAAKTLIAASGDSVYVWADQSGNGFDATQATAGSRPTLGALASRPALLFTGALSLSVGAGLSVAQDNHALYMVGSTRVKSSQQLLAVLGGACYHQLFNGVPFTFTSTVYATDLPGFDNDWGYVGFVSTPSAIQFRSNGWGKRFAAVASATRAGATLGSTLDGSMGEVILWDTPTDADRANVEEYLDRQWPRPTPALDRPLVITAGNSVAAGFVTTGQSNAFPSLVAAALPWASHVNYAYSGAQPATITPLTGAMNGLYRPTRPSVVVVCEGLNDSTYGNYRGLLTTLRAKGHKVVAMTVTPNNRYDATAFNTSLRADTSYYDALADVAAIPGLVTYPNVAMYPDGLHWSDAAHALAAAEVQSKVESLLQYRVGIIDDGITSAKLAASATAEIADGVWDEALSGHATAGSTGEAMSRVTSPVAISPILAQTGSGDPPKRRIEVSQGSAPLLVFTVVDSAGNAVNLTGKTVRFVAGTDDGAAVTAAFQYQTGGTGVTVGGAGGNVVSVQGSASDTAVARSLKFWLWNITDNLPQAKGDLHVVQALKSYP